MGVYINPPTGSKEEWLLACDSLVMARRQDIVREYDNLRSKGLIPLVWVDNGDFSALGVMYCKGEAERMCIEDERPKMFCATKLVDVLAPEAGLSAADKSLVQRHAEAAT